MSVYFIKNPITNKIKIGKSNDPQKRLRQLQNAAGDPLEMLLVINTESDKQTEEKLHDLFISSRSLGEWFLPSNEIISFIEGYNTCLDSNKNYELNFNKFVKNESEDSIPKFSVPIDDRTTKLLHLAATERDMSLSEVTFAMLQCAIEVYYKTTNRKDLVSDFA
jgi:hypothetical protein